ncbi:MAG: GTP-binding protein [Sedimentisphaerales bacterium]|nr:GTP-binding protein [Sedimentisphaerales bacterium]
MATKAALITPVGASAIATIQIVGGEAGAVLGKIFVPAGSGLTPELVSDRPEMLPDKLYYGSIFDGDEVVDKVVAVADGGGETVDINCHGGPRITQRILMLLNELGVEVTSWRELHEADSMADEIEQVLPGAKTRMAVLALTAQCPGGLTGRIKELATRLEKDSGEEQSIRAMQSVRTAIKQLLSSYALAKKLLSPPTVVLAGPVNVGKSTLANALTGKTQSITADLPGTTRDWTVQLVEINGLGVNLIDTAGRRAADDRIEEQALARADEKLGQADLVILVLDNERLRDSRLEDYSGKLPEPEKVLTVVNKSDLMGTAERDSDYLYISALKNENLDRLREAVAGRLGFANFDPTEPLVFTERQQRLLNSALGENSAKAMSNFLGKIVGR